MQYIKKPRQVEGGQSRNFMTVIEVREIEYALQLFEKELTGKLVNYDLTFLAHCHTQRT